MDERTHIIAVHARYCGSLHKGEYQFKFGENNNENCEEIIIEGYEDFKGSATGFLMPQSGYIKKIRLEMLGVIDLDKLVKGEEKNIKELKSLKCLDFF